MIKLFCEIGPKLTVSKLLVLTEAGISVLTMYVKCISLVSRERLPWCVCTPLVLAEQISGLKSSLPSHQGAGLSPGHDTCVIEHDALL